MMGSWPVLIVGAGLCGLTAARRLIELDSVAPDEITIVERDDDVGGRLATRAFAGATLDTGAQFFTVRSDELQADVERWVEAGVVVEWCRGFSEIDGYPRYRAAGGMQGLAAHLATELRAAGVTIETGVAIDSVEGRTAIVTAPVPQTIPLLTASEIAVPPELADFACHRVFALWTVLDRSPDLPGPGALQQPADPTFSFVADNQAKGLSDLPAVTFHTAHGLSAELWPGSDADALAVLLPAAAEVVAPARIVEHRIERWPCSGPVTPYPEPCLQLGPADHPVILAGDNFGTSKVEGAYLSGRAAAERVTEF